MRRRFRGKLGEFIDEARGSLSEVVSAALEVDAARFRDHLRTDSDIADQLDRDMRAISAMLQGEQPQLESVPTISAEEMVGEGEEIAEEGEEAAGDVDA